MGLKHVVFRQVLDGLALTRLDRLLARWTRGSGVILMLHRVVPSAPEPFAPNALLQVTPSFLDAALACVRRAGFDLVGLDEALARLCRPGRRPFAAVTFDDGYRDTLEEALPVLRSHGAPATVFVTPGFADRSAPLWWVDLERAVATASRIQVSIDGAAFDLDCGTIAGKTAAFDRLYWTLRAGPEERLRAVVADLARANGIDSAAVASELCLDWDGLATLAADPLVTVGAHTMTHPMLAKHPAEVVRAEMERSRAVVSGRLGLPVDHFAYPVGDAGSAGPREFTLARELGFASAVTTRPGLLFPEHADHLAALPRLSLNGLFQDVRQFEVLLSGVPFALWNRGRRVSAE